MHVHARTPTEEQACTTSRTRVRRHVQTRESTFEPAFRVIFYVRDVLRSLREGCKVHDKILSLVLEILRILGMPYETEKSFVRLTNCTVVFFISFLTPPFPRIVQTSSAPFVIELKILSGFSGILISNLSNYPITQIRIFELFGRIM